MQCAPLLVICLLILSQSARPWRMKHLQEAVEECSLGLLDRFTSMGRSQPVWQCLRQGLLACCSLERSPILKPPAGRSARPLADFADSGAALVAWTKRSRYGMRARPLPVRASPAACINIIFRVEAQ